MTTLEIQQNFLTFIQTYANTENILFFSIKITLDICETLETELCG